MDCVRDLGVTLDSHLTLTQHIRNTCRSASWGKSKIGRIRKYLDKSATDTISPCLRYITSGLLQQSIRRSSILSYCTTTTYPEHSCKAHHPHQEIRAHHASNSVSSLAPDPSTHHLQNPGLFICKIKHDLAPSYLKCCCILPVLIIIFDN